jgi:hypothetical protein
MILFRLTFRDKHIMREEVMERHSFLVAALLLRVLRASVVMKAPKPFHHEDTENTEQQSRNQNASVRRKSLS